MSGDTFRKRRSLLCAAAAVLGGAVLPTASLGTLIGARSASAQTAQRPRQAADENYRYENAMPAFSQDDGMRIVIHRAISPYLQRGAMEPFARLCESDGYEVEWLDRSPLTVKDLDGVSIFAVINPYAREGEKDYRRYSTLDVPSMYSQAEINLIRAWVEDGGALLVLADHSPFTGGALALLAAFGYTALTGFAVHRSSLGNDIITNVDFKRTGQGLQVGRLSDHPITNGALGRRRIENFYAFDGQAIIPSSDAVSLLTLPDGFDTILTLSPRREMRAAPRIDSSDLSQGAVENVGKGRIAVFGEAGAFTRQSIDNRPAFGLATERAPDNEEFILSLLRGLVRFESA